MLLEIVEPFHDPFRIAEYKRGWLEVCPDPLPGGMTLELCFSYSVVALDMLGSEDM